MVRNRFKLRVAAKVLVDRSRQYYTRDERRSILQSAPATRLLSQLLDVVSSAGHRSQPSSAGSLKSCRRSGFHPDDLIPDRHDAGRSLRNKNCVVPTASIHPPRVLFRACRQGLGLRSRAPSARPVFSRN